MAASASLAAKVGAPTSGSGTTTDAAKPSNEPPKPVPPTASTSAASNKQAGGSAKPASTKASGGTAAAGSGQHGGPSSGGGNGDGGNGGFWPGLIGGVIGGAATALAASLFWMDGGDTTTALESRLAAAEQQVEQIGALDDRVAAVEALPSGSASDQDGDLAARFAELEAKLAALSPAGLSGDGADDGLGDRVTSLEQQLETLAGEVQTAFETQQANQEALSSLQNTLPTLEETLAATGVTLGQTSEQTTALKQTVETPTARVGDTESRLDHIGGEYQRGAAMIVAIGDINRAVTRSEPFDGSLETLKSLVRDDAALGEALSTLEPMAADGVPTLNGLKDAFGQMASRVLLAEEGDQSLTDQVGNNVFGIFNMRPAGADVEGSGSRAVLARAQSKLSADDLEGAILELGGLEGRSAEEAAAWIERADARLAAETAVINLRAHAQGLVAKGS